MTKDRPPSNSAGTGDNRPKGTNTVLPYPIFPEDDAPRGTRSPSPIRNHRKSNEESRETMDAPAPLKIAKKQSAESMRDAGTSVTSTAPTSGLTGQLPTGFISGDPQPRQVQSTQPSMSTNPYLKSSHGEARSSPIAMESSAAAWASSQSTQPQDFTQNVHSLTSKTSQLSLNSREQRTSLQEPSHLIGPHEVTPAVSLTVASPEEDNVHPDLAFGAVSVPRLSGPSLPSASQFTPIESHPNPQPREPRRNDSIDWNPGADLSSFDAVSSRGHGLPSTTEEAMSQPQTWESQQAWERQERMRREEEAHLAHERAQQADRERRAEEEWYQGEEAALREAQSGVTPHSRPISDATLAQMAFPPVSHEQEPKSLSAGVLQQPSQEPPSSVGPSAASGDTIATSSGPAAASPAVDLKRNKKETYQIKHVNWFDATSKTNPRKSPILVQNLNGPCPLLALVNALTLSTPSDSKTALVETLRVREQISLGFLLDAVFDELMSGRRGGAAQELPDVGELYAFLSALHTGMNVNPRFVRTQKAQNIMDLPESGQISDPAAKSSPGAFEETKEMRLYSTFAIPLIHGWLPSSNHRAFGSLRRSAATYEDAQNLMFREEELEDKLQGQGLSPEEQLLLEDISTIKYFLTSSATQLTPYGLDVIQSSMKPGEIAIFFRNDHFSTLYKHPQSGQLLQLITDAGYASHDEIVWESLVDVNGERCEFFSGDFRPIGNVAGDSQPSGRATANDNTPDDEEGRTTVERNSNNSRRNNDSRRSTQQQLTPINITTSPAPNASSNEAPLSPSTEQEDRDFALALQMQEEEEERERRETAARRREEDLSRDYLSAQTQPTEPPSSRGRRQRDRVRTQEIRPLIPPRNSNQSTAAPAARVAVNRAENVNEGSGEAPPPTYEQAANGPAYNPPPNHPAHPNSPSAGGTAPILPSPQRQSQPQAQQQSAYVQTASQFVLPQTHPGVSGRGRARDRAGNIRNQAQSLLAEVGAGGGGGVHHGNRRRQSYAASPQQQDEKCVVM